MKTLGPSWIRCLIGIWCVGVLASAWAQETGTRVTPELLQSRIAAAQDSTDLDDATQARLVDLYRQSVSNLEARSANEQSTEEYRRARREGPEQTAQILATLERRRGSEPNADLRDLASASSQQLTRLLDEETANLTAWEAKLDVIEARLEAAALRPASARARIAAARTLIEALAATPSERSGLKETPQVSWSTDSERLIDAP
jgi:hypothetical protein